MPWELSTILSDLHPDNNAGFIQGAWCLHARGETERAIEHLNSGPPSLKEEPVYFSTILPATNSHWKKTSRTDLASSDLSKWTRPHGQKLSKIRTFPVFAEPSSIGTDETHWRKSFDAISKNAPKSGASVSVWKDGQEILTLNYGWRDLDESAPWTGETLCPVWSVTKGPAAIATLHARSSRLASPPLRASAKSGRNFEPLAKAASPFSKLLAHGAGLAALDSDNRPDILNHRAVVAALEKQEPNWTPGKAHGYHPRTYGFLLDEIVRRVSNGKRSEATGKR